MFSGFFNMVTADREGEGKFFMSECTCILALYLVTCLGVCLLTCFRTFSFLVMYLDY